MEPGSHIHAIPRSSPCLLCRKLNRRAIMGRSSYWCLTATVIFILVSWVTVVQRVAAHTLTVGTAVGFPGDVVTIPVVLDTEGAGLSGLGGDIRFDPDAIAVITCTLNPAIGDKSLGSRLRQPDLERFIAFGFNRTRLPDGVLFTCEAVILPDASTSALTPSAIAGVDTQGKSVQLTSQSGRIVVLDASARPHPNRHCNAKTCESLIDSCTHGCNGLRGHAAAACKMDCRRGVLAACHEDVSLCGGRPRHTHGRQQSIAGSANGGAVVVESQTARLAALSALPRAGDLNGDGVVNVLDVQLAVNVFLGAQTDSTIVSRADLNADGVVTPLDVFIVVDIALGIPRIPPTISGFSPNAGPPGTRVLISGQEFIGVTAVQFNGTSAVFTVVADTSIRATVPTGATTGPISVTTLAGTQTSDADFTVPGNNTAFRVTLLGAGPSATAPRAGVEVLVHDPFSGALLGDKSTDTNGVADFGNVGRTQVTVSVVTTTQDFGTKNITTFVNIPTGTLTLTSTEGITPQTIVNVDVTLTALPAGTTEAELSWGSPTNLDSVFQSVNGSSVIFRGVEIRALQSDSKFSLIGLAREGNQKLLGCGVAADIDPASSSLALSLNAGSAPVPISFATTEPVLSLAFNMARKGLIFGNTTDLPMPLTSGLVHVCPLAGADTYFLAGLTTRPDTASTRVVGKGFTDLPTSVVLAVPDLAINSFARTSDGQTTAWTLSGADVGRLGVASVRLSWSLGAVSYSWEFIGDADGFTHLTVPGLPVALADRLPPPSGVTTDLSVVGGNTILGALDLATGPSSILLTNLTDLIGVARTLQPAPVISAVSPTSGSVGSQVVITGQYFTGTSSVQFNGITASFTVNSDSSISATVPPSASTGPITATTSGGTGTSVTSFTVPGVTLTLTIAGTGGGIVTSSPAFIANCLDVCVATFPQGTQVSLTALPTDNSAFSNWSGCDTASANSCTVTMTSTKAVAVNFSHSADLIVSSFSPASATPGDLLTINGIALDPTANWSVRFFDQQGYSVSVPVLGVTPSSIMVAVPPYFNVAGQDFTPGLVNVEVTQNSSVIVTSNALLGLAIQDLPPSGLPAGTILKTVLDNAIQQGQRIVGRLDLLDSIFGTNSAGLHERLADITSAASDIQTIIVNPTQSLVFATTNGHPLKIDAAALSTVDRLLMLAVRLAVSQLATPSAVQPLSFQTTQQLNASASLDLPQQLTTFSEFFSDPIDKDLSESQRRMVAFRHLVEWELATMEAIFRTKALKEVFGKDAIELAAVVYLSVAELHLAGQLTADLLFAALVSGKQGLQAAEDDITFFGEEAARFGKDLAVSWLLENYQGKSFLSKIGEGAVEQYIETLKEKEQSQEIDLLISRLNKSLDDFCLSRTQQHLQTNVCGNRATSYVREIYRGTGEGEVSSLVPISGCSPSVTTTFAHTPDIELQVTNGSLLADGPFSGFLLYGTTVITVDSSAVTCTTGETTVTIPGSTNTSVAAGGSGSINGSSDGQNVTIPVPNGAPFTGTVMVFGSTVRATVNVPPPLGLPPGVAMTFTIFLTKQ